jgi:hypothetical protein
MQKVGRIVGLAVVQRGDVPWEQVHECRHLIGIRPKVQRPDTPMRPAPRVTVPAKSLLIKRNSEVSPEIRILRRMVHITPTAFTSDLWSMRRYGYSLRTRSRSSLREVCARRERLHLHAGRTSEKVG